VLSIWIDTTPLAIRSSVCAQLAGVLGVLGGLEPKTCPLDKRNNDKNKEIRGMPILGTCVSILCEPRRILTRAPDVAVFHYP
jgi:hypothetical protein